MKFLLKILIGGIIFIGCLIGIFALGIGYYSYEESKFYDIEIPQNLNFEKPVEYYSNKQVDSLKKLNVNSEKIIIVGNGYSGYDFFIWHKPVEKGEIYIKAFELTQNIQLSEEKLRTRTVNKIIELGENYEFYRGSTVIDEGTFENFYPARFELWFKSKSSGNEIKIAEKNYVIDGWDR